MTLLQRVERMRRRAANGSVIPSVLEDLLADVEVELSRAHDPITSALKALSYSEMETVKHLMSAMPSETGGLLVASQIADRMGITRSVIVNALRKLESAGAIESRSLGMKGTHIKFLGGLTVTAFNECIKRFESRVA